MRSVVLHTHFGTHGKFRVSDRELPNDDDRAASAVLFMSSCVFFSCSFCISVDIKLSFEISETYFASSQYTSCY